MKKKCNDCGILKSLSEYHINNNKRDGCQSACKNCSNKSLKLWRRSRAKGVKHLSKNGGPYRVVYDPCNSFTDGSSFRRTEIAEMLANEHLAIGTRFRRGMVLYEVSSRMTLLEVTA